MFPGSRTDWNDVASRVSDAPRAGSRGERRRAAIGDEFYAAAQDSGERATSSRGSRVSGSGVASQLGGSSSLPSLLQANAPEDMGAPSQSLAEKIARLKKAKTDPFGHLRRSGFNMGLNMSCPPIISSTYARAVQVPVVMANDAKWSTDLKMMDKQMSNRLLYQRRLTAATPGAMIPEQAFIQKNF